jgi:4-amino-4-deoxy-L-arabinose transferase-like glycosyltransferase
MSKKALPILVLIFLIAFTLRIFHLTDIPPGLTHDEANHGREALGILDGVFLFFFPFNYGSEPLYSYTIAGSMLVLGKNLLALRWVNVVFGLAAIAMTYAWVARAFNRRMALLAAALMAVSFWPLATSRQALRAGMLPLFVATAVWFFWQILCRTGDRRPFGKLRACPELAEGADSATGGRWLIIGFGFSVAVTLHIYLAARVAWLVFPAFLLYLALTHRKAFRRVWAPTLAGLALAGLLVTPMLVYLQNHPEALTRLEMLDRPLQDLRAGRFGTLLQNAYEALLAFVWPGYGDAFLAYNIPGRPVFDVLTAFFFIIGIFISLWRWRHPPFAFLLIWFGTGIAPSLVTGATANTTRNLAALPAVYVLPAIGFVTLAHWLAVRRHGAYRMALAITAALWLSYAGFTTVHDYFIRWGQSAEVRGAYQHTLTEVFDYLERTNTFIHPVVISSVYPGPAHDPSIGLVLSAGSNRPAHWIDARYALLIPPEPSIRLVIPDSTPPHPAFRPLLQPVATVRLRPDDLDPGFTLYSLAADPLALWPPAVAINFGDAASLLHARWLQPAVSPGATAELLTAWRVLDPARVGPIVPPANTTDVVLFTQLLDESGDVFAQRDSLEAPSWDWQPGDVIIQVHPIAIPAGVAPGAYPAIVGIYDRQSRERLPVLDDNGDVIDTRAFVTPLQVVK